MDHSLQEPLGTADADTEDAARFAEFVETIQEPVLLLALDLRVVAANAVFREQFALPTAETVGRSVFELADGAWDSPGLHELLEEVLRREGGVTGYRLEQMRPGLGPRVLLLNGRELGSVPLVLLTVADVTHQEAAEAERARLREELRTAQEAARADLEAMTRLQALGTLYVREGQLEPVLAEIVGAAIAISGADFGNIQLFDEATSSLKIVAHRGFPDWWLAFWNQVSEGHGVCGTALERRERVIVEDVEHSPIFVGTPALEIQRRAGVRAVQSTPLVSRSGAPLGMFSTHYRRPCRPDDRALRLLDLLARQAADIIARTRAEEALRSSEARFRAFVSASSDVVYSMSADWKEMRQLRGMEFVADTEHSSSGWLDRYVDRPDQPPLLAAIEEAIRDRKVFELEHRVRRIDGTAGWSFSRAVPMLDASGAITEWIGAARDVTDRRLADDEARRQRELLQRIFDNIPVLLVLWGPRIRFTLNRQTQEVLGWSDEEANGLDLMASVYPDPAYRAEAAAYMQSLQPGFREMRCRTKGGDDVPIAWANVRLADDTMIGIGVDLRERKRAEEALRGAKAQLEEMDRRKNEFLAMLSHELRNPLAPIRSSLFVLDRAVPGGEDARRAQVVIDRQVGHMTRLIEDLLDVTRITRGKVELRREPHDLAALAIRTADDHRAAFVERGVELVVLAPDEVWVDGDRTRLAQVIGNLLQNSAKFTPRGGRTTIAVEGDPQRGAVVRVTDTGRGIAPEILPHLFEPFTQADATLDRTLGGLGLGLALVKGLTEMHGGSVDVTSEGLGKGATFSVTLPLAPAARAVPRAPHDRSVALHRVLVIEDNVDAAESLRDVLELLGHEVRVASTGPEGIEVARSFAPGVVLCDIGLPGMDGFEVAQAMREDPALAGFRLVALSGYAGPDDVARAKAAGFDQHLAKPATVEMLEEALAALEP